MSALTNTVNYSLTSVAPVAKPKFVLPANLLPTLGRDGNSSIKLTTPPVALASPSETVAPEIPADAACNLAVGSEAPQTLVRQAGSVTSKAAEVSNAAFMTEVFGAMPQGVSPLVCSKLGDPTTGPWIAKPAAQVQAVCLPGSNNYFNSSSVHADPDGDLKARKNNVAAFHFLLLDDVGTKVEPEKLNEFKASWAIETSPGNYQLGILLATPLANAAEVTALQDAVITAGLCDPGANGMTRWARLPVGVNGKAKYTSDAGQPFQCRLVRWRPEMRYTVDEIVAGLKLEMAPVMASGQHVAHDTPMAGNFTAAKEIDPADVAKLPQLLAAIDPDCGRLDWVHVLMAVYHTTGGSEAGFALVDAWSGKGKKYPGTKALDIQWRSFSGNVQRPITIGTLIKMARDAGADVTASTQHRAETFEHDQAGELRPVAAAAAAMGTGGDVRSANPLTRYSLSDSLAELERQKVDQVLIFGQLALLGQATVIYALANTGKTLIMIHLIIEAIKKGLVDPSRVYYINMDDNSSGLVDKVRLVAEYGFHMIADGHRGFEAKEFREAMVKMIETNTARGAIVVLDTLKKFVNTMNKDDSRSFTKVVRQFSLKGGTVIALSHANKNPGADGKIKYTGTTDIVDDFDCAYTLQTISAQADTNLKLVEFTNFKRRGDVALNAAYSYALERGLSYNELLSSVQEVDPDELKPLKQAAELESDAAIIAAVEATIVEGIVTKMKIVDAAAARASVTTRQVLKVIEKYTGNEPSTHRWQFAVRARGAQCYELLAPHTAPTPAVLEAPAPLPVDLGQGQQNGGLPEPAVVAALTPEEQFHMGIVREGLELCGDAGGAEDQTHDEF